MFQKLFLFLAAWLDKLIRIVQVGQGFGFWLLSGFIGIAIVWLSVATFFLNNINRSLIWLFAAMDSMRMSPDVAAGIQGGITFMDILKGANTFIPVSEMFAVMISVSVVAGFCAGYGLFKSWLPGIGNV